MNPAYFVFFFAWGDGGGGPPGSPSFGFYPHPLRRRRR